MGATTFIQNGSFLTAKMMADVIKKGLAVQNKSS
jgi:hypothetical protein